MKTENTVSDGCRLIMSRDLNGVLLRNNSGAFKNPAGRFVRFGLGNDGSKASKERASSDLIGITPMLIQQWHVGRTVGVFTAVEAKAGDWMYRENDQHTQEQLNFLNLVVRNHGIGLFCNNEHEMKPFIERFIL